MDHETWMLLRETAGASLLAHAFIRRYRWGCAAAVLGSPVVYFAASFIRLGLPPAKLMWFPQVVLGGGLYSLPVAVLIGLPFLAWRRRHSTV